MPGGGCSRRHRFPTELALGFGVDRQSAGRGTRKAPRGAGRLGLGEGTAFRQELEQRGLADALGISKALAVWPEPPGGAMPAWNRRGRPTRCVRYGDQNPGSVKALALVPEKRFRKVTWREGSPGKRAARCWATRVQTAHDWNHGKAPSKEGWLWGEWAAGESEPVKYEWCDRPKQRSLKQLVVAARGRWRVAQDYQPLQEELGLDPFEGRSWTGCHQHVTMVLLAPLFLRLEQQRRASKRTLDAARNPA